MKRMTWRTILCTTLMIATAAWAQDKASTGDSKPREASTILKIIDPELLARMVDLASRKTTCDLRDTPPVVCEIVMTTLSVGGKDYCVAIAPEVKVPTAAGGLFDTKRRIRWKLDRTSLMGDGVMKELAFHDEAGIVLTVDPDAQMDRWGKLGDGGSGAADRRKFHTWTRRDKLDASATYLPVILWGPPETAELCAAIDPKIVNVL